MKNRVIQTDTVALPNGAGSVYSDTIALNEASNSDLVVGMEIKITAPALVVGDLANGDTMIYEFQTDNDSAFGSPTTLAHQIVRQVGAGGAGAAAVTTRWAVPSNVRETYGRVKITNSASGDASDKSATIEVLA